MKKFFLSLSVLALGFMASCQQEELVNEASQTTSSLKVTASLEENTTSRTQLSPFDNGYKVWWSENDAIRVFGSEKGHAKYVVKGGINDVDGSFEFETGDDIWEGNDMFVGVYPHSEATTIEKSENGFKINTVIPTTQAFVAGSFGKDAYPMVAVSEDNDFAFKNIGSIIIVPLNGNAIIKSATLESTKQNIAGAATVTVEAGKWIPTVVDVTNGEKKVVIDCGEEGVILKEKEDTYFCFVMAPGTFEDEELTITFKDSHANSNNPIKLKARTYERSSSFTLKPRTYIPEIAEKTDLWIKAEAKAYANGERMIPAIDNLNFIGWVKDLASRDKDEICSLLKQGARQAALGNYKATYDILGGIPGFTKETKKFEYVGENIQPLQYSYTEYINTLLQEINDIDTADEFVAYINRLTIRYDGIEDELDNTLGTIGDLLGKYESVLNMIDILGILDSIKDINLTKLLLDYSADKDGIMYKFISKVFEYDMIINKVQEALTTVVEKYIEQEKAIIDKENVDSKEEAIALTKGLVIYEAQYDARMGIDKAINATNKENLENLNKGPWGIMKKIIAWEPCVKLFEECNITQVREALLTLCENVEWMISYERIGLVEYEVAPEDYVEEKHWWVRPYPEF